jgi:hypothetical protein
MNGGGGARGEITSFSKQSAKRLMIKVLNAILNPWWQTFTFPDEVLTGKTLAEITSFSQWAIKTFKERINAEGFWRREWELRKSGEKRGVAVPHVHLILSRAGVTEKNYEGEAIRLALIWLEVIGALGIPKAVAVNCHRNQYQWLHNPKQAVRYLSKYMAKVQGDFQEGEKVSLGRMWGKVGCPGEYGYVEHELSYHDEVNLGRLLKRFAKACFRQRKKPRRGDVRRFRRVLACLDNLRSWLVIEKETIVEMMAWGACQPVKIEGCPF